MTTPKFICIFSSVVFWELLCFTFRFLIHLKLICVKSVRSNSRLIFLYVQLFQHYLLKRLCCIVMPLFLCQKSGDYIYVSLFLDFLFYLSFPSILFWLLVLANELYSKSWSKVRSVYNFVLFFTDHVNYSRSFVSSCVVYSQFVDIHKIICWCSGWDCIESITQVEMNRHFDNIKSSYL